jgi:hypothetical protein
MDVAKQLEQRLESMKQRRKLLVESWAPFISAADKYLQKYEGRSLTEWDKMNMAQVLENALVDGGIRSRQKIFETTYQDNISFLGVQLPVIAALLPSLVLNRIAVVQALDRRQAAVFYLNIKYGSAKGEIAAGDTMIGAKTGHAYGTAQQQYARTIVYNELVGTGNGSNKTFTKTLDYKPVKAGTVIVTDGTETFVDNGNGTLTGSGGGSGTINYTTGALSVAFYTAPGNGVKVKATYRYNYEKMAGGAGVPEVDISLVSEMIEAEDFPLKAFYTLGAAIDLEKAHGLILEDEVVKFLGGEIKFELDHLGIDMMLDAAQSAEAAAPIGNWSATVDSGQEWLWKKYEFLDRVEKGSNAIFAKTLRGMGNFIVAGNNVARVIRQLEPHFKPAPGLDTTIPTGPIEIGTLDGRIVIQDPFLSTNTYLMGFKGDSYLFAGFIYAPYIPLFTTPTLVTADLRAQKGFLSAAGYKVVNAGLFTYGTVSNLA